MSVGCGPFGPKSGPLSGFELGSLASVQVGQPWGRLFRALVTPSQVSLNQSSFWPGVFPIPRYRRSTLTVARIRLLHLEVFSTRVTVARSRPDRPGLRGRA